MHLLHLMKSKFSKISFSRFQIDVQFMDHILSSEAGERRIEASANDPDIQLGDARMEAGHWPEIASANVAPVLRVPFGSNIFGGKRNAAQGDRF
jgi:hypothetical protein